MLSTSEARTKPEDQPMDGMIALLLVVAVFVVIDLLAVQFGVDSREPMGDDHAR
jgi:hypothetical protein